MNNVRVRLIFEPRPGFDVGSDAEFRDLMRDYFEGINVYYAGYIAFPSNKTEFSQLGPFYQMLMDNRPLSEIAELFQLINTNPHENYHIHVQLEKPGESVLIKDLINVLPESR